MLNLASAREELQEKTYVEIQIETAWKWASRAAATYERVLELSGSSRLYQLMLAEEYCHEAIEHAALTGDDAPGLILEIQKELSRYATDAMASFE